MNHNESIGPSRRNQRDIVAGLRALILDGLIAPGEQLPSSSEIADEYNATPTSISRALDILEMEGLVDRQKGRGVYVSSRDRAVVIASHYPRPRGDQPYGWLTDTQHRSRATSSELLEVGERPAPRTVASVFGIERNKPVVMRHQLLSLDGEPAELVWNYYPIEIARGTALAQPTKIQGGSPRVLTQLGLPLRNARDKVGVRNATRHEWSLLKLPADIPVLRTFRVVFTDDQRPVEASILVKAGHQYEVEYELKEPL